MLFDLTPNQPIRIEMPPGISTTSVREAQQKYGGIHMYIDWMFRNVLSDFLPDWSIWSLTKKESSNNLTGKWPTRFAKALHKHYDYSISDTDKSHIGEYLRRFVMEKGNVFLDFTDRITWEAGAFGDSSSCWFRVTHTSYQVRKAFEENQDCFAVRLFDTEETYPDTGIGRCFSCWRDNGLYLFNARGSKIEVFANMIARITNQPIQTGVIDIAGSYTDGGAVYVGSGEPTWKNLMFYKESKYYDRY